METGPTILLEYPWHRDASVASAKSFSRHRPRQPRFAIELELLVVTLTEREAHEARQIYHRGLQVGYNYILAVMLEHLSGILIATVD